MTIGIVTDVLIKKWGLHKKIAFQNLNIDFHNRRDDFTIIELNSLKSPEHGLGINMGRNLNYPLKSK